MDTAPVGGWENCQTYWPGTTPNTFVAATPFNIRSPASTPSTALAEHYFNFSQGPNHGYQATALASDAWEA